MFGTISDIILIAIFAITFFACYKKGLIASVSHLLSLIGGIIFARMFSFVLDGFLYRRVFEPLLHDTVKATLSGALESAEAGANAAMDAVLASANEIVAKFSSLGLSLPEIARPEGIADADALTQSVAAEIAAPIATWLSEMCAYIVLFFVGYIILRIVFSLLNLLAKLPIIKSVNRLLGAVVGLLLAALYTFIGAQVLRFVYGILLANGTLAAGEGLGYILTWLP